jgi:hypothetical protein
MMSRYKKILIVLLGLGMTLFLAAPSAYAARPHTLPAGTKVTGNLASGTKMTFKGTINGVPITVTCTTFTAVGKVPKGKSPKKVNLTTAPTIKGCTDNLHGIDTIKTNSTNGKWSLSMNSTAPYTMTLTMPKASATFSSSVLPSCVITAAPTAKVAIPGSYDGVSTDTVTNAPIATSGSGCASTSAKTSATVVLSPAPGAPPF